jgi:hypothetical protein
LPDVEIADRLFELEIMLKAMRIIQLGAPVLKRAKASFPTVVRSLDAIHLASAEMAKASSFLSQDKQQLATARALGLGV